MGRVDIHRNWGGSSRLPLVDEERDCLEERFSEVVS
jgi:hypothetical protein